MDWNQVFDLAASTWAAPVVQDNVVVSLNVIGALLLGIVVGYERTWNGRAAGMRTYGFVCMASAALIVVTGHPQSWFGGHPIPGVGGDPTRVIQGIVTGVGFLGAGVIMKDGFSITGLTTAASIWTVSAIGVLVGMGFYTTAMVLTLLATIGMLALRRIELLLPAHGELAVRLRFATGAAPMAAEIRRLVGGHGYDLVESTLAVIVEPGWVEWHFLAITRDKSAASVEVFAHDLGAAPGVLSLQVSTARN